MSFTSRNLEPTFEFSGLDLLVLEFHCDMLHNSLSLGIPAATKDITGGIAKLRPCMDRNMRGRKQQIASDAMRGELVEVLIENRHVGIFYSFRENAFPKGDGIRLLISASKELQ